MCIPAIHSNRVLLVEMEEVLLTEEEKLEFADKQLARGS